MLKGRKRSIFWGLFFGGEVCQDDQTILEACCKMMTFIQILYWSTTQYGLLPLQVGKLFRWLPLKKRFGRWILSKERWFSELAPMENWSLVCVLVWVNFLLKADVCNFLGVLWKWPVVFEDTFAPLTIQFLSRIIVKRSTDLDVEGFERGCTYIYI